MANFFKALYDMIMDLVGVGVGDREDEQKVNLFGKIKEFMDSIFSK